MVVAKTVEHPAGCRWGRRAGRRTLDERVAAAATARICKTAQRRLLPPASRGWAN